MSAPRVYVRPRSRYAEVVVDLWPCDYDLTESGAKLCWELLEDAARRAATRSSSVHFSAGRSIVQITRCRREEAGDLADRILAVVTDPRYQEPLRWPDGDEGVA